MMVHLGNTLDKVAIGELIGIITFRDSSTTIGVLPDIAGIAGEAWGGGSTDRADVRVGTLSKIEKVRNLSYLREPWGINWFGDTEHVLGNPLEPQWS
jgi:hypothetical protein